MVPPSRRGLTIEDNVPCSSARPRFDRTDCRLARRRGQRDEMIGVPLPVTPARGASEPRLRASGTSELRLQAHSVVVAAAVRVACRASNENG